MTQILKYDSNRTGRDFNERDPAMGAMLITALQWIEPTGFGLDRTMVFTNSQNRLMGALIREKASDASNPYLSSRIKNLFDVLYRYSDPEIFNSWTPVSVYNIHERINLWNLVYQAGQAAAGNKSLVNTLVDVINNNGLLDRFSWLIDVITQLEICLDKGISISGYFVNPFLSMIELIPVIENTNSHLDVNIVAESNIGTLYLANDGIWRFADSFITIDKINSNAQQQYDDSRPYSYRHAAFSSSGIIEADGTYLPTYVEQKDLVSRTNGYWEFPLLSFNNRRYKLIGSIPLKSSIIVTEETVPNLDVNLNGLMPDVLDPPRSVLGIVGLTFDNGGTQSRHYFHCRNFGSNDEIIEFNSLFDYSTNPVELPATNHLMDACTFSGTIFSIDPIQVRYINPTLATHQCLLITGNFTLTETSSSNVYTNVAIWNPTTGAFLEYLVNESINDFFSNAANFFANETLIYKTDSYSKFLDVVSVQHSPVVFGFGTKLASDNHPVTAGMFNMSGPFFIVDVISDNSQPTTTIKLNFILPKDIEGMNADITNYQNWLTDMSSFTVQKIGEALPFANDNEVCLYTGKGIFFLDVLNLKIRDRSFVYQDKDGEPDLLYKIPVEGLSGEPTNFYAWTHPNVNRENLENYTISTFPDSFPKYVSIDDRLSKNIIDLTHEQLNDSPNTRYINSVKLLVSNGWGKIGNLSNKPAEYNNVCSESFNQALLLEFEQLPGDTLIETNISGNGLPFNKQTKLILATLENHVEVYPPYGEGWEPSNNNAFYNFQEVELPMGYGEIIYSAHLAMISPPPP